MSAPYTVDRLGVDLRTGDIIVQGLPDGTFDIHRIGRLAEYPGRFIGDGSYVEVIPDGIDFDIECGECGYTERNVAPTAEDARRAADAHACHARVAYGTGAIPCWRHTVADHEVFHILTQFPPAAAPPAADLDRYALPPVERLVWPAPKADTAYPEPVTL